jgi:hypothetical protein
MPLIIAFCVANRFTSVGETNFLEGFDSPVSKDAYKRSVEIGIIDITGIEIAVWVAAVVLKLGRRGSTIRVCLNSHILTRKRVNWKGRISVVSIICSYPLTLPAW